MADTGSAAIEINAEADRILDVVTDIEAYPQWQGAFKKALVLERDSEGRPAKAEFEVDAMIKTIHYVLEYSYSPGGISWSMVEGDVKEIKGSYRLEPKDGSTEVTYAYEIDAGFPMPGFLRKQGVKMMVSGALNDLKKRAEEG